MQSNFSLSYCRYFLLPILLISYRSSDSAVDQVAETSWPLEDVPSQRVFCSA